MTNLNKLIDIHDEWYYRLKHVIETDQFKELGKFIGEERKTKNIFPLPNEVFRIFKELPALDVKIVIIGQDCYPNKYMGEPVACGYAFAPRNRKYMPPSLKQIYNALKEDLYKDEDVSESELDLTHWVKQGVMLLNTALTVEEGKAGSHLDKWRFFTEEVIKCFNNTPGIIFVLWGAHAQKLEHLIDGKIHHILKCSHPASAIYSGTKWSCPNFREIDNILFKYYRENIEWFNTNELKDISKFYNH